MNQELDLEDLIEFDPQTGNGLKYILNSDSENLKDELCLNFVYEYESCWGEKKLIELKEGGETIFVD
jgi:hypothetical protein